MTETTECYNREQPHVVKNILKGFIEGIYHTAAGKDETKKTITKHLTTNDPEVLEATYRSALQVTDFSGMPNLAGIRNAMDEVAARMSAVKMRKPQDFVDTKLLKEIEKEGFFKRLKKI